MFSDHGVLISWCAVHVLYYTTVYTTHTQHAIFTLYIHTIHVVGWTGNKPIRYLLTYSCISLVHPTSKPHFAYNSKLEGQLKQERAENSL